MFCDLLGDLCVSVHSVMATPERSDNGNGRRHGWPPASGRLASGVHPDREEAP